MQTEFYPLCIISHLSTSLISKRPVGCGCGAIAIAIAVNMLVAMVAMGYPISFAANLVIWGCSVGHGLGNAVGHGCDGGAILVVWL